MSVSAGDYLEGVITAGMVDTAERWASSAKDGVSESHKFGHERGRLVAGYVGELFVESMLPGSMLVDDANYDLLVGDKKVEVKTTSCAFRPSVEYAAVVNSSTPGKPNRQGADYYVFCRILKDYTRGGVVGCIPCVEFHRMGTFIPKGGQAYVTPSGVASNFVKADHVQMLIKDLLPISELGV